MAVTSVSEFSEDFIRALSGGVAGAWRERWWTVDLLLVHGTEALAATEQAQEEFFHLYEALKRRGSRIMLAADRPPSEIAIDERLRSRFEGGLVLDLEVKKVPKDAGEIVLVEVGQEAVPKPSEEDIWARDRGWGRGARGAANSRGWGDYPATGGADRRAGGGSLQTWKSRRARRRPLRRSMRLR